MGDSRHPVLSILPQFFAQIQLSRASCTAPLDRRDPDRPNSRPKTDHRFAAGCPQVQAHGMTFPDHATVQVSPESPA